MGLILDTVIEVNTDILGIRDQNVGSGFRHPQRQRVREIVSLRSATVVAR